MARLTERLVEAEVLVGGRWRPSPGGTYDVVDPATEAVVGIAADATEADAREAAAAAKAAAPGWGETPLEQRVAVLAAAADLLEAVEDDLVELVIAETGATRQVAATTQVRAAIDRLRRFAATTTSDLEVGVPTGEDFVARRAPVGPVAAIAPYNFPLLASVGKAAPALVAGNPVVLKPAPQDPLAVRVLADALHRAATAAGAPPSTVQLLTSRSPTVGEALVASPDIAMVSFTGSTAVGQAIYAASARTMKRLLLELGGKAACIVCDDADLDAAMAALVRTWTVHAGQVCLAPTRAVVHAKVHDELVQRLTAFGETLTLGDPRDAATDVGPLISGAQLERVRELVARGEDAGGRRLELGRADGVAATGFWHRPALLDACTADNPAAAQEIFGPVLTVVPVRDDDEAVRVANSTAYGLYDYVFSEDEDRARRIATRLDAAQVAINTHVRPSEAPFGGTKLSGLGRAGGILAVQAYTELRTTVVARGRGAGRS